ncbi:MAG: C-GCAxxG-C-C family (seleno)protein [Oscillospiraceae bacterium]|nr:C-GCAxxG-C-C family (seleno)protein [Oscillospiraceae bacterium]
MLREIAKDYFINQNYNCAETMLHAINCYYDLGLTPAEVRLMGGFGGGLHAGHACGALCGCMAALSRMLVTDRAHTTEGFDEACKAFVDAFIKKLGSTMCYDLKLRYRNDTDRCLKTVELAADAFEEYAAMLGFAPKA